MPLTNAIATILLLTFCNRGGAQHRTCTDRCSIELTPIDKSSCERVYCSAARLLEHDGELIVLFPEVQQQIAVTKLIEDLGSFAWSQTPLCYLPGCHELVSITGYTELGAGGLVLTASFLYSSIAEDALRPRLHYEIVRFQAP